MTGNGQEISSVGPLPAHGDVIANPNDFKAELAVSSDHSVAGRIHRELGHQRARVVSATKASSTCESSGSAFCPKVSM